MDFHDRAPRVGGSDFGVCENFAYRVRDIFFVRGGYAKKKSRVPPQLGGSIFNFFQKLGLRDSAYPVRLFRNVEYIQLHLLEMTH